MRKLYEKKEILFAFLLIIAYYSVTAPIKGAFGLNSLWTLLALLAAAAGITAFVVFNRLETKYGIAGWPEKPKNYLFFLPLWILAAGNLCFGFAPAYQGTGLVLAVLSMIVIGYTEEMLFRGFLFRALLIGQRAAAAVTISALTFGIGHIVNLLNGQTAADTLLQIVFAVSWGLILTTVFYVSGCLFPCVIAHAVIDVFSLFAAENRPAGLIYTGVTAAAAVSCCLYLSRLKKTGPFFADGLSDDPADSGAAEGRCAREK